MFVTDGDAAIRELQQLLADPNIEVAVRQGDIYAVIIEYFAANNNFKSALNALQDMKAKLPKVSLNLFIVQLTLSRQFVYIYHTVIKIITV